MKARMLSDAIRWRLILILNLHYVGISFISSHIHFFSFETTLIHYILFWCCLNCYMASNQMLDFSWFGGIRQLSDVCMSFKSMRSQMAQFALNSENFRLPSPPIPNPNIFPRDLTASPTLMNVYDLPSVDKFGCFGRQAITRQLNRDY